MGGDVKAWATSAPDLSRFSPNDVLEVGGEALADPFLRPVLGSNNQTEPGVGDLMAHPGPAQRQIALLRARTPSIQHTLGQENDVGAGERHDRNNRWERGIELGVGEKSKQGLKDGWVKILLQKKL